MLTLSNKTLCFFIKFCYLQTFFIIAFVLLFFEGSHPFYFKNILKSKSNIEIVRLVRFDTLILNMFLILMLTAFI